MLMQRLSRLVETRIASEQELRRYVLRTTSLCLLLALAVDVVQQLTFFVGWTEALRSWAITAAISSAIAFFVSRAIGRSHLRLFTANQIAETLSRTDPLTGLLNRRALLDYAATPDVVVLVIVDIDRFKRVNDTYGHIAGDAVIRTVAELMVRDLGDLGKLGRLGGEEFAVLGHQIPKHLLMEKLTGFRDHLAATPIVVGGQSVSVTISAGVAVRPNNRDFAQLYNDADRALYLAKATGRNRIAFAGEDDLIFRRSNDPARSVA
jgi:diguanylate cyclase (GGDEF)-like protein